MNCDCVDKVNQRLAEAGHDYKLAVSFVFDDKMNVTTRLALPTAWNDTTKRKRKPPPTMLCTLCPFCGTSSAPKAAANSVKSTEESER